MTDNASAGATPAAGGATPPQSTADTAAAAPATGTDGAASTEPLGDAGKKALEAERAAARDALKRAEKAEKDLKALQEAQLSDAEKRDKRLAELEAERTTWDLERQRLVLERAVERQAVKAGADPEIVLAMVLANRSNVEFEADGSPKNLDRVIGDLVKAKPGLLINRTGSSDLGTGSASRTAAGKTFTREQLRDPEFFQANKADIMKAMQEGRISG